MIDNSLIKLLENIEPKIQNIEENRIELKELKAVRKTMNELIESAKDSYQNIIDFYDQDFIMRAIKIKNSDYKKLIDKYNSSRYLLKTDNSNLKELPQYQEALSFMDYLYQYLYGLYESINMDFKIKKENLEIQEIFNKYYGLLSKDNIYIKDIDEFLTFIELNNIENQDRVNLYKLVINSNLKRYLKSSDIELEAGIKIENIEELLNNNQELLNMNYIESDGVLLKLDDYLKLVTRIDEEIINNRQIYLIHKIKDYYDLKKYAEITDYYKEFIKIKNLQEEFKKQKKIPRRLLFTYENDVSLVRKFIDNTEDKYKNCILKNLLDIENENIITIPKTKFDDMYIYLKDEYLVKTVYTFLEDGKVLILGVLDKNEEFNEFLEKNMLLFRKTIDNIETISLIDEERDLLLENVNLEDLMLNIDLETLDIKRED